MLKVRNFLPPQSQEPEIFLLEKLVNQAAEADQRLESVAKAQGQTSDGKLKILFCETFFNGRVIRIICEPDITLPLSTNQTCATLNH